MWLLHPPAALYGVGRGEQLGEHRQGGSMHLARAMGCEGFLVVNGDPGGPVPEWTTQHRSRRGLRQWSDLIMFSIGQYAEL